MAKMTNEIEKCDVLLYISDQHTASCNGFMGDTIANTPNLDKIAQSSLVFNNAYTSCPLCVPARASFMTSRLPSNIGVFNNASEFKAQEVTFAHLHELAGYETNLIGRMHFVGMDYYHGFTRRIGDDISNSYWGYNAEKREDWGDYGRSISQIQCLEVIGSGDSPVLEYDRQIVSKALEFYDQDYDKPQLTVVGTYSPHFPYVCQEDRVKKFEKRIRDNFYKDSYEFGDSPIKRKVQLVDDEDLIKLRAAYYAMIEIMDEQIGEVYNAYQKYLKRNGKKGIFIYMSDHGDQIGYHQIYGKQTFFEKSAQIPFIIQMDDQQHKVIEDSISIMDIGPTLCELNLTEEYPVQDGESFAHLLRGESDNERYAISEYYDSAEGETIIGYMIHQHPYKLITYKGYEKYDLLFNTDEDPNELTNLITSHGGIYEKLKKSLESDLRIKDWKEQYEENNKKSSVLERYGQNHTEFNKYTYIIPESVRFVPDNAKRPKRT